VVHRQQGLVRQLQPSIAEGFVQKVWTFNGELPGPVIRTEVGSPGVG